MLKNQKGITLVALVITIIVLLILAGVSISLVIGNNGILNQASNASVQSIDGEFRQAVEIAAITARTKYEAEHVKNSAYTVQQAYTAEFSTTLTGMGYTLTGTPSTTTSEITVTKGSNSRKYDVTITAYGDLTVVAK